MSTAFERSVMQNSQVVVHHELLADPFYFGVDRKPKPLDPAIERSFLLRNTTYAKQLASMLAEGDSNGERVAGDRVTFSKELSIYYQRERLPAATLAQYTHCFLIRRPDKVARSFLRFAEKTGATDGGSTYFDADELGFVELEQVYRVVTEELHVATPVVIDADELVAAPEKVLRAWCRAVGLPFEGSMLKWQPLMPAQWEKWPGWHDEAAKSVGFMRQPHSHTPAAKSAAAGAAAAADAPLPEAAQRAVEMATPIYEHLYALCTR